MERSSPGRAAILADPSGSKLEELFARIPEGDQDLLGVLSQGRRRGESQFGAGEKGQRESSAVAGAMSGLRMSPGFLG
jgi:hypothetical protein